MPIKLEWLDWLTDFGFAPKLFRTQKIMFTRYKISPIHNVAPYENL